MKTGEEMPYFAQRNQKNRGRPLRHESERMRTIAWYHSLAGGKTPAAVFDIWPPFQDLDQATVYRYRRGDISPSGRVLDADDEISKTARSVYEVGPLLVPLWDALWGSITPSDFRLADRLMPGGDWAPMLLEGLIFDDVILSRILSFRECYLWGGEQDASSELEVFAAALRVVRAWSLLGQGHSAAFRVLLEGTMALPRIREVLEQYGLVGPLQDWIASQFSEALSGVSAYWAPWMSDEAEFARILMEAGERKLRLQQALFSRNDSGGDGAIGGWREDVDALH